MVRDLLREELILVCGKFVSLAEEGVEGLVRVSLAALGHRGAKHRNNRQPPHLLRLRTCLVQQVDILHRSRTSL